jgi:uncharacterized protein YcaQ
VSGNLSGADERGDELAAEELRVRRHCSHDVRVHHVGKIISPMGLVPVDPLVARFQVEDRIS